LTIRNFRGDAWNYGTHAFLPHLFNPAVKLSPSRRVVVGKRRVVDLTEFYRARPDDAARNVVVVKIFPLRDGLGCVVSWPLPEPGLRPFYPTPSDPETALHALPYAQFLREHLRAERVVIDLDESVVWEPAWGRLAD
jgi:hypothetical protein